MKPLSSHAWITLYTKSNTIYSGAALDNITLTHQPPATGAFLKISVSGGTNNTGNVIINGSESIEFTGADWKISATAYSPTITITTTGFSGEAVIPTLTITSVDMAGNPITWSTSASYVCEFRRDTPSSFTDAILQSQGLSSPTVYRVRMDYECDVALGQEFTIDGITGVFIVWNEPLYHMQLGTDLVDYIEFKASLRRNN